MPLPTPPPAREVDHSLRELNPHGTFDLPVETYTGDCAVFHALYNHWHQEMEFLLVEKGRGFLRLNRERLRIREGDLLVINPGVIHGITTDLSHILYFKSIVFRLDFLGGSAGDLWQERVAAPLMENQAQVTCRIAREDGGYPQIRRLFEDLHACHSQKAPYYFVRLKALFYELFYELLERNYIVPATREQNKNAEAIKRVLDYIRSHYQEDLPSRQLASLSNFSESYFMRLFREYTGKTLVEYRNGLRLEKAKALLVQTGASVTEIALQVGFSTTSYFIKCFQRANGVTPFQFRKQFHSTASPAE